MLSIATVLDLDIIQLDVKTAHGEIEEETYIKQPEGYVIPGRENESVVLKSVFMDSSNRQGYGTKNLTNS
jgi:hypothetical protein